MNQDFVKIGETLIDIKLMRGYTAEALRHINEQLSYKEQFEEVVEAAAAGTKLDKKLLSAYFKARHKESTKEQSEKGALFEALDEALA